MKNQEIATIKQNAIAFNYNMDTIDSLEAAENAIRNIEMLVTSVNRNSAMTVAAVIARADGHNWLGDMSPADYLMNNWGFKKTQAYSIAKVARTVFDEKGYMLPAFQDFSAEAVVRMLSLGERSEVIKAIEDGTFTADMSAKDVAKKVSALKAKDKKTKDNKDSGQPEKAELNKEYGEEVEREIHRATPHPFDADDFTEPEWMTVFDGASYQKIPAMHDYLVGMIGEKTAITWVGPDGVGVVTIYNPETKGAVALTIMKEG